MNPQAALAHLDPAGAGTTRVLHCLRETPISSSWLVEREGGQAVLRLDTALAGTLGLDRDREWRALQQAGAAGLAPLPLARDEMAGLLLRAFVPGDVWSVGTLRQPARLADLGRLLRRVHTLPLAGPPLDTGAAITRYMALGGASLQAAADTAREHLALALAHGTRLCQCHNDPVAGNLVAGGEDGALRLIDWEYAAPHDPWFDLAAVVAHHDLVPAAAQALVAAYLGRAPSPAEARCLGDWQRFYRALAALWTRAVVVAAAPDGA